MSGMTGLCAIWNTPVSSHELTDGSSIILDSPRTGGQYWVSLRALELLRHRDEELKARLTTWLIEQRRFGTDCPRILPHNIDEAEQQRSLPIHERADNLLRYIQNKLPDIGTDFYFETDNSSITDPSSAAFRIFLEMLAWSESKKVDELLYLLNCLEDASWLQRIKYGATCLRYRLTVPGHSHLAEIDHVATDSSKAFVAMWFDDSLNKAWKEGIRPAITDTGYKAVRIDEKEYLTKIDDEIIAEIRRARFLVADFTHGETGPRGGVYYEAGFAYGLNIPVIFTCRKDALEKIHFDTRQYPHIDWETPKELRDRLANRISAILGDGPLKG